MKVHPVILLIISLVIVALCLTIFIERKKSDNTVILDSIRVQNEQLIEENRIERAAYQDSINGLIRLNTELVQAYTSTSENWKNEYRKTTLLHGPALDSAWAVAIGRIVTKYESGSFDPAAKVRYIGNGTKRTAND